MMYDWKPRGNGMVTPAMDMPKMLDDLHVRILRLEGKEEEAAQFEAARIAYRLALEAEDSRQASRIASGQAYEFRQRQVPWWKFWL